MCVILIAKDKHPTDKMVEQAWKRNDDGGGLAWREKNKAGDTIVRWHKGIESVEEMYDIMMKLPFPYVAHFRIASSGGIRPEFTHPYPVEPNVSVSLKGTTNGYVLFHNGDWKGWDDYMLKTAAGFGARIPRGKFNDTRAMAWLTHVVGDGFLEVLPTQKGVLFGPKDYEVYVGGGWTKINDVWCSNDYFWEKKHEQKQQHIVQHQQHHHHDNSNYSNLGPFCTYGTCNRKDLVTGSRFCPAHHPVPKQAQGGSSPVVPFPQTGRIPLVSVELAQKLCPKEGRRQISKNLLKKILECHDRAKSTDLKKQDKAIKELALLSAEVFSKVVPQHGSGLQA